MSITQTEVLIIGGGLTGLTLGYLLQQKNMDFKVLEARERLGGRISTQSYEEAKPLEMGATWLGKKHHHLNDLLETLGVGIFEQALGESAIYEAISTSPPQLVTLAPNTNPSFRVQGGTYSLIDALQKKIPSEQIHTGQVVQYIQQTPNGFVVKTDKDTFHASFVVSTLPPFLLVNSIDIQPVLPNDVLQLANQTHTWMGESIKVGLTYAQPFWREKNTSGTIMSNVGPIPEMYDHSNYEDSFFALKGFLNGAYFSVSKEQRIQMVLKQLSKYYGEAANNYLSYEETVWRNEPFTFKPYAEHILPHQNNGHPAYHQAYLSGKFFIAGAETAPSFPGYMDGAVQSAFFVSEQILEKKGNQ
ncbi:MAG: flavin monoamine oxidase family protein [Chitinophagales bacterium]